jgi:hypothetical protein
MTPLIASFIAGAVFLGVGIFLHYFFVQQVYPVLSERHEAAKVGLEQGTSPAMIAVLVQLASYVALPIIGFFMFGPVVRALLG